MDEPKAITIEISKLQLLPGDVLVLKCPEGWTLDQIIQFRWWLDDADCLPAGVKTLILSEGTEISVLTPVSRLPLGSGPHEMTR